MAYVVEEAEVGYLSKEVIRVVRMPRETFLSVVGETLDNPTKMLHAEGYFDPIREQILNTARNMDRFPMATWIDDYRGCGCIVGEVLVADEILRSHVDHLAARSTLLTDQEDGLDVYAELQERFPETHAILTDFGSAIDLALRQHIRQHIRKDDLNEYYSADYDEILIED